MKMMVLDREILRFIDCYSTRLASEAAFNELALKIFDYQFHHNTPYRSFCLAQNRSPRAVSHWKEIPAIPSAAFKEHTLATFPVRKAVRIFQTSGTTAKKRGRHFFETLGLYEASILAPFKKYFKPAGTSFFFLTAPPHELKDSSLSHMMGVVNRYFAQDRGKFFVKKERLLVDELFADLRKKREPVMILSTAFSLAAFLDYLKGKGQRLRLPKGSRLMETGGFKGKTKEISKRALYGLCAEFLGIPSRHIVSEYGMTELSSQYYAAAGGVFEGPAWLKPLVIDPVTGKEAQEGREGFLRHFDLANKGSALAIQTEDIGRKRGEGGFELLNRLTAAEPRGCSLAYEGILS